MVLTGGTALRRSGTSPRRHGGAPSRPSFAAHALADHRVEPGDDGKAGLGDDGEADPGDYIEWLRDDVERLGPDAAECSRRVHCVVGRVHRPITAATIA